MEKAAKSVKAPQRRASAPRCGRPPLDRAGEVEARILDAATRVFLDRGFEGASVDLIAETAHCGKPTIYARYANKEALFAAAVADRIALKNARMSNHKVTGATIEARLAGIAVALVNETLTDEFVGLYRLCLAEARRFPDLVRSLSALARRRGGEVIGQFLADVSQCGRLGDALGGGDERLARAARYFIDLVLLPLMMRALAGEPTDSLRAEFAAEADRRVAFFLAACLHGGVCA
jgi:AcrR family transcriptional regulator